MKTKLKTITCKVMSSLPGLIKSKNNCLLLKKTLEPFIKESVQELRYWVKKQIISHKQDPLFKQYAKVIQNKNLQKQFDDRQQITQIPEIFIEMIYQSKYLAEQLLNTMKCNSIFTKMKTSLSLPSVDVLQKRIFRAVVHEDKQILKYVICIRDLVKQCLRIDIRENKYQQNQKNRNFICNGLSILNFAKLNEVYEPIPFFKKQNEDILQQSNIQNQNIIVNDKKKKTKNTKDIKENTIFMQQISTSQLENMISCIEDTDQYTVDLSYQQIQTIIKIK